MKWDHDVTVLKILVEYFRAVLTALLLAALSACASPAASLEAQAIQLGFKVLALPAGGFVLSHYYQPGQSRRKQLHVYLEGDGQPWRHGLLPAAEPTTRATVMLPLMAMDAAPALYLGRPCYNGHAADAGCTSALWTNARYGEQVLATMATAIQTFCHQYGYRELVLIGHSGGGSLAMLLAERLPQTKALVTLAGNYDIVVWADYHGYQHLTASANPADHPNSGIPELHLLGEDDRTVPLDLFGRALQSRPNSQVERIKAADHHQGWEQVWPKVLVWLEKY